VYKNYVLAKSNTTISTSSKVITSSIEKDYLAIKKHEQTLLIRNDPTDQNLGFWRDKFTTWEPHTFEIFDRFLNPTKTYINIGGWIGTTCIYASRKSKNVVVVEADPLSYKDLERNCRLNDCKNVNLFHKALFNETGRTIGIVGNNESTSQITLDGGHPVETISIHALLLDAKIDPTTISIIKVDIEGGEEFILHDLYSLHKTYSIPLYVSFHYSFFKDKNLDRFDFLTEEQKKIIRNTPFPSIIFISKNQVEYFI
jgi:FkbM family methyltransferase